MRMNNLKKTKRRYYITTTKLYNALKKEARLSGVTVSTKIHMILLERYGDKK